MGWGRMLLLGNWGQQMDIEDQRREIEDLKQQMEGTGAVGDTTLKDRIARLERDNNELRLYLVSLVRYLGRKGILQQDDFRKLVEAVDVEDGSRDGGYRGRII